MPRTLTSRPLSISPDISIDPILTITRDSLDLMEETKTMGEPRKEDHPKTKDIDLEVAHHHNMASSRDGGSKLHLRNILSKYNNTQPQLKRLRNILSNNLTLNILK